MVKRGFQIILLLLIIALLWKSHLLDLLTGKIPLFDADAYYLLAKAVWSGQSPYQVSSMQTLGPPSVIIPFIPLQLFSLTIYRTLLTLINLFASGLSCWFLSKLVTQKNRLIVTELLICLLLLSFPARFTIQMGQLNLVLVMFFSYFFTHAKQQQNNAAILGVISVIKTHNLLMIFSLVKNKRFTIIYIATITFLVLASLWWIKPAYYQEFISKFTSEFGHQAELINTDYYNQSLPIVLSRLGLASWSLPIFIILGTATVIYLIYSGNILAAIIAAQLLSPVAWQHYYVIFFPIYFLLWKLLKKNWPTIFFLLLSLYLTNVEFPWLHQAQLNLFTKILSSHYYLGGIILLILVVINQKQINSFFALSANQSLPPKDNPS